MKTEEAIGLFLQSRRSRKLSEATIDTYRWALMKMEQVHPLNLPETAADVQQVLIVNSTLSSASLRTIWARLRIFWSWAEDEGICANVMKGIPAPVIRRKLPRILRSAEIRHLMSTVEVERDHTILAVLLDTGIRIGELASMTCASVMAEAARDA